MSYNDAAPLENIPELDALKSCTPDCAEECRLGTDLSCLQKYSVPESGTNSTTVVLTFIDSFYARLLSPDNVQVWLDDSGPATVPVEELSGAEYKFSLPERFEGFFRVSKLGYFPTRLFLSRPLIGYEHWTVHLIPEWIKKDVEGILGAAVESVEMGVIVINAYDCSHSLSPGIQIRYEGASSDPRTKIVYFSNSDYYDFGGNATDDLGAAAIFNVPPGRATLHLYTEDTNQSFGLTDVQVWAGEVTWVAVFPAMKISWEK